MSVASMWCKSENKSARLLL